MSLLVIVQARTGSSRLPGKVLLPIAGKPLLQRMLERVRAVEIPFRLIVATTTHFSDNPVRKLCARLGVKCYSGHPTDLLDRHYQAAKLESADAVAKIPSDCPLIDPAIIDRVLGFFLQQSDRYDFVSNLHPATYPDGNDVEVMHFSALETAWREAKKPFEREHTTPFLWEQPQRFRIGNVTWETGLNYSMTHRWTIDYPEDYNFLKAVFEELWSEENPIFHLQDILSLLERRPEIAGLNACFAGVNWYRSHLHELKTISPAETRTAPTRP
jgi:spore coat polysaccharide biosynthesis protein SpsF